MSILIKNVEMPKFCRKCPYVQSKPLGNGHFCTADHFVRDVNIKDAPPDWCPLVEVPTPHGPLIDKDELPHYTGYALSASEVAKAVEAAPTIIEAEEEAEE